MTDDDYDDRLARAIDSLRTGRVFSADLPAAIRRAKANGVPQDVIDRAEAAYRMICNGERSRVFDGFYAFRDLCKAAGYEIDK